MTRPTISPDWATDANYPAGGRPWNAQPNKSQPSAGKVGTGFEPENPVAADELNFVLNNHGAWIDSIDAAVSISLFGNGADGAAVLDGAATVAWATLVGSVYTMTRDSALTDLTINAGITLKPAGFRLIGQGILTTVAGSPNGLVDMSGGSGAAGNAGGGTTADAGQTLPPGGTGGVGGNATGTPVAGAGQSVNSYGGSGGTGGVGAGGGGGAAGIATPATVVKGNPNTLPMLMGFMLGNGASPVLTPIGGGAGGGGGGGPATGTTFGGGGGNGGRSGVVAFRSLNLAAAADLLCKGGNGGAGGTSGGGTPVTGGGGAGGGGTLVLIYYTAKAGLVFSDATNCPAGTPGVGGNGGAAGLAGATGKLIAFNLGTSFSGAPLATAHAESGFVQVNSGDTSKTITFSTPFAAAPPSVGGYSFTYSIMRTDGNVGAPSTTAGTPSTTGITITINDSFQGVICWRASS